MLLRESKAFLGEPVFVLQIAEEQGWIIGVERDHQACVEIAAYRMLLREQATAGAEIGRDTNFQWDLSFGKNAHQFWVLDCGKGMAQALRADVERSPDPFRTNGFAGMSRKAETGVTGFHVQVAEWLRAGAALIPADADADHRGELRPQFCGFTEDAGSLPGSEVAHSVEDPKDGEAQFGFGSEPRPLHAQEERLKLASSPVINDPDGDVDLGVNHTLIREALGHAPRDQFIVIRGTQLFCNGLKGKEEPRKVGVLKQCLRLGRMERGGIVPGAEFDQGFRSDRALKVQVELGFGEMPDEGIRVH